MKIWTDERGNRWSEPDCAAKWAFDIHAIACDYDGETTVEGLKRLVDELVKMTDKMFDCAVDGMIYPSYPPGCDDTEKT